MAGGILSRYLGPRHYEMARNWIGTAGFYGATWAGVWLYLTEWKLVLQFVPYYNTKFKTEEKK